MSKVINIGLILLTAVLAYWLYASIKEPIAFNDELGKRKDAVQGIDGCYSRHFAEDAFEYIKAAGSRSFFNSGSLCRNTPKGRIFVDRNG